MEVTELGEFLKKKDPTTDFAPIQLVNRVPTMKRDFFKCFTADVWI